VERVSWSLGIVLIVMLLVGGMEVNLGLPMKQHKTDQILKQVKNEKRWEVQ
jgi:hypothetical protein